MSSAGLFVISALAALQSPGGSDPLIWMDCSLGRYPLIYQSPMFQGRQSDWDRLEEEFKRHVIAKGHDPALDISDPLCYGFTPNKEEAEAARQKTNSEASAGIRYVMIDWVPPPAIKEGNVAGERSRKTVFFLAPTDRKGRRRGYASAHFDVEYQYIACMGELHLAYSVVPGSVKLRTKTYMLDDRQHMVESPPSPSLEATDLTFKVYDGVTNYAEFRDQFAAQALGFGCFTGQSKEVGKINKLVGEKATKAQVQAFVDTLDLDILSNSSLLSAAAEDEIRRGGRAGSDGGGPSEGTPSPLPSKEDLQREQVTKALQENSDNFASVKAAADAAVAQQKAAQEAYEQALRETAAARAKFEQAQAAHQAELARARAAEIEYERQREEYRRTYKKVTGKDAPQ